jgi:molybdopterin molybdotransferase
MSQHGDSTIGFDAALAMIDENYRAFAGVEQVSREYAHKRILAADIVAPIAVPPADNSAVDGYVFSHASLSPGGETEFRIAGTAAAGHPFKDAVKPNEAVRIFTGAVIPAGADTVAMQENVRLTEGAVTIPPGIRPGENRRAAGEDIAAGSTVLSAGKRMGAGDIGILASLGIAQIPVRARLRVAVFSVGDELIGGGDLAAAQIHDSNRPMLLALLNDMGIAATDLGILPDRIDSVRLQIAEAAKSHDAIVCSAGMSAGGEDHVRAAVEALGQLYFWSVAIKPGRPVAAGRAAGVPFFGLPGNPVAAAVTFSTLVRRALLLLSGARDLEPRRYPVMADFSLNRKAGKREFLRCNLQETSGGRLLATRFQRDGSGVLSSISASEGLLEIAEDIETIAPGMILPFIPFAGLGL